MNKTTKLSLFILVAAMLVISGCARYLPREQAFPVNNQPVGVVSNATSTEPIVATSTVENIDKDWNKYKNNEYGFEVIYPQKYDPIEYKSKSGLSIYFKDEKNYFEVRIKTDYHVDLDNYSYLGFSAVGKGKLGGQEALVFKAPMGYCDGPACGSPFIAYSTKKNDIFYNLVFYKATELTGATKKILDSFKFTN